MTLYAQETVSQISSFKQENLKKKGKIYKKKPAKCKPQDTKLYTKFTSKLTNRLIQQNPATSNAMNFNPWVPQTWSSFPRPWFFSCLPSTNPNPC